MGYVCTDEATTDLETPIVRARAVAPTSESRFPPVRVRARDAPQYLRIPTKSEQDKGD
jgi:hypothetical protein